MHTSLAPSRVVGDDRSGGGEGLRERPREAFASGQVDEHVHDPDVLGDLGRGNQAGEDEIAGEVAPQDLVLEGFAVFAVPDQEELDPWKVADEVGSDGDEVLVALVVEEAGDLAHHEILGDKPRRARRPGLSPARRKGSRSKPLTMRVNRWG